MGRKVDPKAREEAVAARAAGSTLDAAAKTAGVSLDTARRASRAAGPSNGASPDAARLVVELERCLVAVDAMLAEPDLSYRDRCQTLTERRRVSKDLALAIAAANPRPKTDGKVSEDAAFMIAKLRRFVAMNEGRLEDDVDQAEQAATGSDDR